MKKVFKTEQEKESIISEYLIGDSTYRSLEKKYGIDYRIIHSWVTKFKGKTVQKKDTKITPNAISEPLSVEVKVLQEELRKTKLHNELLNTMIDIAEEQLKINIRKKSGTKQ